MSEIPTECTFCGKDSIERTGRCVFTLRSDKPPMVLCRACIGMIAELSRIEDGPEDGPRELAECANPRCRVIFLPKKRAGLGRASYCPNCGVRAAWRAASRRYYKKTKVEMPEVI